MNAELNDYFALLNKEVTRAVLSKCIVEQMDKALLWGTLVDNMRETVLNIRTIMHVLSPKEHSNILNSDIGKFFSEFRMGLVLTTI